jgi:glycosyltransferase involved in cell wall biosynthesis
MLFGPFSSPKAKIFANRIQGKAGTEISCWNQKLEQQMEKRKKIVLITSLFPYGGACANLVRYFTFCLKDAGHNIEVFLPVGAYYGNKLDQQTERKGNINGIKYKRLGFIHKPNNLPGKIIDNFLGILLPFFHLLIKTLFNKLDLIIVYNPTMISIIPAFFSKFVLRRKLLFILPEFYEKPKEKEYSFLAMLKWYNFYFGIKHLIRYADKFIVLSHYLKSYTESRLRKPKPILLMPNLCDVKRFEINGIKDFKENLVTIGYVGTPVSKDGILDLIKSFGIIKMKYPKTHLLIIGDITNGKTIIPELKKYAGELGIVESSITFKGLTSHAEIPALLLSCQILALTRPKGVFAEAGFPTKLGEYFSCRKPVLITRVGDMNAYFEDKEHVVFAEPENIASIVDSFEYLLKHPDKAKEIGKNGYKWMDNNLNYLNQAQRISDFVSN